MREVGKQLWYRLYMSARIKPSSKVQVMKPCDASKAHKDLLNGNRTPKVPQLRIANNIFLFKAVSFAPALIG